MNASPPRPMPLYDAHCHLQDARLAPDLAGVMARAAAAGVEQLLCCGTAEKDWPQVLALATRHPQVRPALGLHPWHAGNRSARWVQGLWGLLCKHPAAAVGEIGLDHALATRNDAEQAAVFREQLALAREMGRPAVVHCRRAWGALLEILRRDGPWPAGFMIHSYSGAADLVPELAALGAYFSFSGSLTLHGNRRGHAAAQAVPEDRLLIETDAPDLPPARPGRQPEDLNEPANLVMVRDKLAELRGLPAADVARLTWNNARRLFG